MSVKTLLSLTFGLFTIFSMTPTYATESRPTCPNAKAFQNIAFDSVLKGDHPGVWTLIQKNQSYNTSAHWDFSLMVEADDQEAALKKAKLALANLRKKQGPEKVDAVWVCDYASKSSLAAMATTVPNKN